MVVFTKETDVGVMIESDEGEVRWSILGIGNRTCKNAVADKGVFHLFFINL